jgi:hypothetical protein
MTRNLKKGLRMGSQKETEWRHDDVTPNVRKLNIHGGKKGLLHHLIKYTITNQVYKRKDV